MTSALALLLGTALLALAAPRPALAHHVGTYAPRDNDISTNFKQIKFALRSGRPDVALRLFEAGAVRTEMRQRAARLPEGLEDTTRDALRSADAARAEVALMVLFAALARDLALEADRQLADERVAPETRIAAARRFVEAIWRYYNLIDFVVTQQDHKAAVGVRLAIDEAEAYVRPEVKAEGNTERAREPLRRIAQFLSAVVDGSSPSTRRSS
jgi:hypothetical protein